MLPPQPAAQWREGAAAIAPPARLPALREPSVPPNEAQAAAPRPGPGGRMSAVQWQTRAACVLGAAEVAWGTAARLCSLLPVVLDAGL